MRAYKNERAFVDGFALKALHAPREGRVAWVVPAETRKGLPDLWFSGMQTGWIEAKYERAWPRRALTTIPVDTTPEQIAHLREATTGGRRCWVLLGVCTEWFLLPWQVVGFRMPAPRFTRAELAEKASWRGHVDLPGRRALARAVQGAPETGPD